MYVVTHSCTQYCIDEFSVKELITYFRSTGRVCKNKTDASRCNEGVPNNAILGQVIQGKFEESRTIATRIIGTWTYGTGTIGNRIGRSI